jgi:outer membrane protein
MKKLLLFTMLVASSVSFLAAQKIGYVNTESIMAKIPEYKAAQDEVDRVSKKWEKDLEDKYKAIEQMYNDYTAQEVLLPEDVKKTRQNDIFKAEREAKEYRESKFGYSGELFQLQNTKVKPIQDRVFKAVETVAKAKAIDMVYDKAGDVTWLYVNAKFDLTDDVMIELGVKE